MRGEYNKAGATQQASETIITSPDTYRHVRFAKTKRVVASVSTTALVAISAASCSPEISLSLSTCATDIFPKTAEQKLCDDRRTGTLTIVSIADMGTDPRATPLDEATLLSAGEYAAKTLDVASRGAIKLIPRLIKAPPGTADAIREKNAGFVTGRNCIDAYDKGHNMGDIIAERMPRVMRESAQVVVYGGDSCSTYYLGQEGFIGGESDYSPSKKIADVYTDATRENYMPLGHQTKVTQLGEVMAHEIGHDYGMGHAGKGVYNGPIEMYSVMNDVTQPIRIEDLLSQNLIYSETGSIGNFMSNGAYPLTGNNEQDRQKLTNALQENYLQESSFPHSDKNCADPDILFPEHIAQSVCGNLERTIEKDPTKPLKAITLPLSNPVHLQEYVFTAVSYQPEFTQWGTNLHVLLSTDILAPLFVTVDIGLFKLDDKTPRMFSTQGYDVIASTVTGDDSVRLSVRQIKRER